jgi:hypothetical protein
VANPVGGTMGQSGQYTRQLFDNLGINSHSLWKDTLMQGGKGGPSSYTINLGGVAVQGDVASPILLNKIGSTVADLVTQAIRKHELKQNTAR